LQRAQAEASEFGEIPERDWQRTRQLVAQRFPRYGHYNAIRPVSIEVGSAEQSVGDAIDDLTDIIDQLAAVEWCFGHTSEADALWHFFDGFDQHWGEHLRALQLYLHCSPREASYRLQGDDRA
jgi:hypothetical protein